MVAGNTRLMHLAETFTYADACRLAEQASHGSLDSEIRLGLPAVTRTTTAALARLIVLRKSLRQEGRDLMVVGLTGQAEALYEINRLQLVLPRRQETAEMAH